MKQWMKKMTIIAMSIILMCAFTPYTTVQASTANANITIDGYYDDWSGIPYSWEYNWNNPYMIENYWDGTKNTTKYYLDENGNPYNLEIRHKMSLYCDSKYVYLHIEIASNYNSAFNGDDYQIYVDGQMARFRLTYTGGSMINKSDNMGVGIYAIEVRNGDGAISGTVVNGATAMYTKKLNNKNNEVELKIPLSALKTQNSNININNFNTIQFFTPNLMYRKISCSGTSTGPYVGVALCSLVAGGAVFMRRRKMKGSKVWDI